MATDTATNLDLTRQPDAPLVITADFRATSMDRRKVDNQILALQRYISDGLINGVIVTYYTVHSDALSVLKGDALTIANTGTDRVVRMTAAEQAVKHVITGVALENAAPGSAVRCATFGFVSRSVTGLAAGSAGPVRLTSSGRLERVAAYEEGDFPVGYVNELGMLLLAPSSGVTVVTGETAVDQSGFLYSFSISTSDADPSTAYMRFDSATLNSVSRVYIDLTDALNRTLTTYFDALGESRVWIEKADDKTVWAYFRIASVTTATGYRKLVVTYLAGPGGFENDDLCRLFFDCNDLADDAEPPTPPTVPPIPLWSFEFSNFTTDADPGQYGMAFDQADAVDAETIYLNIEAEEGDISQYLDALQTGELWITSKTDTSVWNRYDVTAVENRSGYRAITVTWIDGTGNFDHGAALWLLPTRSTPPAVAATTAGLAAITNAFRRVSYGGLHGLAESPVSPPDTECEVLWIPEWNRWLRFGLTGFEGDPADGNFAGGIFVCSFDRIPVEAAEGGLTGATPFQSPPGGWMDVDVSGFTDLNWRRPLVVEVFPWNGGVRIALAANRTAGNNTTDKIRYNDNGGSGEWHTASLNEATNSGPYTLIWTGTNLVAGFTTGRIEYSSDGGETWNDVTEYDSEARLYAATNGDGTVVFLSNEGHFATSLDHGVTWVAGGQLPAWDAVSSRGVVFLRGKFYIVTKDMRAYSSIDGITWMGPTVSTVSVPGWEPEPVPLRGLTVCGDYIAALCGTWGEISDQDICYSRDGIRWERAGVFHGKLWIDSFSGRVRLRSSTARSPAHIQTDAHQLCVVPDRGTYIGAGGGGGAGDFTGQGLADCYLGHRDGGSVVAGIITDATPEDGAPPAVGGAPSPGLLSTFRRGDAIPDIGRRGTAIASATSVNLTNATGDHVHITGTEPIEEIILADGLSREVTFDDALSLVHSSTLVLNGSDITTADGHTARFRGEASGVVRLVNYEPPLAAQAGLSSHQRFVLESDFLTPGNNANYTGPVDIEHPWELFPFQVHNPTTAWQVDTEEGPPGHPGIVVVTSANGAVFSIHGSPRLARGGDEWIVTFKTSADPQGANTRTTFIGWMDAAASPDASGGNGVYVFFTDQGAAPTFRCWDGSTDTQEAFADNLVADTYYTLRLTMSEDLNSFTARLSNGDTGAVIEEITISHASFFPAFTDVLFPTWSIHHSLSALEEGALDFLRNHSSAITPFARAIF